VTTPDGLLHSFCGDCLPAFRRQMKLEGRCIQHPAREGDLAASDDAAPGMRRQYRKR
jgi:hypothetical protein